MKRNIDELYLHSFLNSHKLAVLSTVNQNGLPDAAPIFFISKDNFRFFFITPALTQKSINLQHQPEVVLTITDEEKKETALVRGIAQQRNEELVSVISQLAAKLNGEGEIVSTLPLLKHQHQEKIAICIEPYQIVFRKYTDDVMEEKIFEFQTDIKK